MPTLPSRKPGSVIAEPGPHSESSLTFPFPTIGSPCHLWILRMPATRMAAHRSPLGISTERSEEHTSELQSQSNLVCRLLLEKKKKKPKTLLFLIITSNL